MKALLEPAEPGAGVDVPHVLGAGMAKACVIGHGDINLDGDIDERDSACFMDAWAAGDGAPCDLNRDGVVDADDLAGLMDAAHAGSR